MDRQPIIHPPDAAHLFDRCFNISLLGIIGHGASQGYDAILDGHADGLRAAGCGDLLQAVGYALLHCLIRSVRGRRAAFVRRLFAEKRLREQVRVVRVLGKSDSFPEKGTFNGERVKSDPRGLAEFRQALAELAGKRVTLTLETGGAVQSFNFEAPLDERGFPVRIKE